MDQRTFWTGVGAGAVGAAVVATAVAASGAVPMRASGSVGPLDRVGDLMFERAVDVRARDTANPYAADRAAIEEGLRHFKEMCLHCHGAPGVAPASWSRGMQPEPPPLDHEAVQSRSDGELHYIIEHGVRMTGMPPFGEDHSQKDLWSLVAFIRQLDRLDAAQIEKLKRPSATGMSSSEGHAH